MNGNFCLPIDDVRVTPLEMSVASAFLVIPELLNTRLVFDFSWNKFYFLGILVSRFSHFRKMWFGC